MEARRAWVVEVPSLLVVDGVGDVVSVGGFDVDQFGSTGETLEIQGFVPGRFLLGTSDLGLVRPNERRVSSVPIHLPGC
jgi:hypothetical protein